MDRYVPHFTITNQTLYRIADIAEKCGRISVYRSLETKPMLRRNNRLRSIYATLAVEGDAPLPLDVVRDIVYDKPVDAPQSDIEAVRNAYQAYDIQYAFDPCSADDLKKAYGILAHGTPEMAVYRSQNMGVFNGDRRLFMAPAPRLVPDLVRALLDWAGHALEEGEIHPLLLAMVLHYELIAIHPFADDTGRLARLWQTVFLSQWNPAFLYVPVESAILASREGYYDAIAACQLAWNTDAFIAFMLDAVDAALARTLRRAAKKDAAIPAEIQKLLDVMEYDVPYSGLQLMAMLGLKSRDNFRKLYLVPALENNLIVMGLPDKPTSRNQTYIRR